MSDRKAAIQESYRQLGGMAGFYESLLTCSTPAGRLANKLMWGFDADSTRQWIDRAIAIPADFSGKMLEVPVGTGVLTLPVYQKLPRADITCLDYSTEMMAHAQMRAEVMGIRNVRFCQGDVGQLPFDDESFDLVLSLNGFHAFPDKAAAYAETRRVLKKGGIFCGCFYVQGEKKRTDWFCKHLLVRKCSFTPPFETSASLERRLSGLYRQAEVRALNAVATFRCVK